jgi:hypothetical protein
MGREWIIYPKDEGLPENRVHLVGQNQQNLAYRNFVIRVF